MAFANLSPDLNYKEYDKCEAKYVNTTPVTAAPASAQVLSTAIFDDGKPVKPNMMDKLKDQNIIIDDQNSTLDFNLMSDETNANKKLTRMHTINSRLGSNTDVKKNMFLGLKIYNGEHNDGAEGFPKVPMGNFSFYKLSKKKDLDKSLVHAEYLYNDTINGRYLLLTDPSVSNYSFPTSFLDGSGWHTFTDANDGSTWDAAVIDYDKFRLASCLQYYVEVKYGKRDYRTDFKTAIQVEHGTLGVMAATLDNTAYDTEMNEAAEAYRYLYGTNLIIKSNIWRPDLSTIPSNNWYYADRIDWTYENTMLRTELPNPHKHNAYFTITDGTNSGNTADFNVAI